MLDYKPIWIVPLVGAILLFALDIVIQWIYRYYASKRDPSVSEKSEALPEEPVLRKMSKLVRFFSSSFVRFECPRELAAGKEINARLSIQLDEELLRQFEYDNDLKLSIDHEVKANLSGEHFHIKLNTNSDQSITSKNLIWNWTIRSLAAGQRNLNVHLVLIIRGMLDKKEYKLWLDERTVAVSNNKLNAIQFWCRAKWKSVMAIGFEITTFYFLLKFVIDLA